MDTYTGRIQDGPTAKKMLLAGKAEVTLVGSEKRFTYRVRRSRDGRVYFVSVLTGRDNETSYQYAGIIRNGQFLSRGKVKIKPTAMSFKAFKWVWARLVATGEIPEQVEMYHSAQCAKCGRKLTVPSSIGRGIGPVCWGKMT
jgi:hypothetical protein